MTHVRSIKRILFAIPVAGAIVFGTSQVFAAPAQVRQEAACPEDLCNRMCNYQWYCDYYNCVCI